MACEKFSARMKDWIADAALGEFHPAREAELLAHVGECEACRDAYQRAKEVNAAIDRGLDLVVSGEPSPHFLPRLRARLAEEPTPGRFRQLWTSWRPVAAAGFALTLLLVILLPRFVVTKNPAPAAPVAKQSQPAPQPGVAMNLPSAPIAAQSPQPARTRHTPSLATPHSNASRTNLPKVLVPPDEFGAIESYADALRSGRIDGKRMLASQQALDTPLEIKPIEIAPIVSPDLEAIAEAAAGSGRP
jgi:hypothetical protein